MPSVRSVWERARSRWPASQPHSSPVATQALAAAGADVVMIDQELARSGRKPARHGGKHRWDPVLAMGSGAGLR